MRCTNCGRENARDGRFCTECGKPLARSCPSCQAPVLPAAKFCAQCGANLVVGQETAPTKVATSRQDAERRQLTVLFCDLVGSSAMSQRVDAEVLRDIIRVYQDSCAGVITRWGGYIARYVGDGLLVYFGFPKAQEDAAERAVRAGLNILDALRDVGPVQGQPLAVRIGIATGLCIVGDIIGSAAAQEQAVVGETPNLAARLQTVAQPDSVVNSAGTKDLIGADFVCEALGALELKGFAQRLPAWRVAGTQEVESRFGASHTDRLTHFVGREHESELLLQR